MSLTTILYTGRSSLIAHQSAMANASSNTANADVVGFSKRDGALSASKYSGGVQFDGARRRANVWLDRRVILERSRLGTAAAQSNTLSALDAMVSNEGSGIGPSLDRFFATLRTLSSAPGDLQGRRDLIAQAQDLTAAFNSVSTRLATERSQADSLLASDVERTNTILQGIAAMNGQVAAGEGSGTEASAARDERDRLLAELADMVEITTLNDTDGHVTVMMGGGTTLVSKEEASSFRAEPDPALGGLLRLDLVSPSGLTSDVTARTRVGRLGGTLQLRDDTIASMIDRVDQLAFDFASQFNTAHASGYGTDGITGRNFFDVSATPTGAAGAIALTGGLASNPDWIAASTTFAEADGGNDNLLRLSSLANDPLASGGTSTFAEEYSAIVGDVGRAVSGNMQSLERATIQVAQAEAMKESQTGVSIDEELIDITRFQRAYQASTRIISTVNQMFDTLMQL